MPGRLVSASEFRTLLSLKAREFFSTKHAVAQAEKRFLPIEIARRELENEPPILVLEQECETTGERKFDVYFVQKEGVFHRYVVCLNSRLRLITLMRTSKDVQKKVAGEEK